MGAHWPAVVLSGDMAGEVMKTIVLPTVAGMATEGRPYTGVLYVGLMLTANGPKVLEYNCRFGDPETQVQMLRLEDDLADVCLKSARGNLGDTKLTWRKEAAACVVVAVEGYPDEFPKGQEVAIDPVDDEQVVIFHGVPQPLVSLQKAGFELFIVTNQAGIGRGYFTVEDMHAVHRHLLSELAKHGISFSKIYFAPEAPGQPSVGRKPSPKFLLDARDEFSLDLASSYMVGDKLLDLECGWNAGVKKSLLVRTGYGAQWERDSRDKLGAAMVVDDMPAAADWILNEARAAPNKM
jgi:histidinol-phosphate phosphatase family protein